MSRPRHATARLTGMATALGTIVALLIGAGGPVPAPPVPRSGGRWQLDGWSAWLRHLGPAGAFVAVVRIVALALAAYLLLVVALDLIATVTGFRPVARVSRAIAAPPVRRLLGTLAGVGLATSLTATAFGVVPSTPAFAATAAAPADPSTSIPATTAGTDDAPPTMARLDDEPTTIDVTTTDAAMSDAPTMRRLDAAEPSQPTGTTTDPTTTTDPPMVAVPGTDPPPTPLVDADPPRTWTIAPGDHLWGVAERTLADARRRPPTDAEIAGYLHRLVDQNVSVLVVPTDPDLVFAGQVFTLVPVD